MRKWIEEAHEAYKFQLSFDFTNKLYSMTQAKNNHSLEYQELLTKF